MILVAGGTGTLGTRVVRSLIARDLTVRVLTRDRARAKQVLGGLVDTVCGDARDLESVRRSTEGAQTVVSAIQGFQGPGNGTPRTVDYDGNCNLIRAARSAGVAHFILISMHGAGPESAMELGRMKFLAEQEVQASGLAWTIIRPTPLMETWCAVLGDPLVESGKTRIFGRGTNPINFVAADDVARFVELAVIDGCMQGEAVDIGGPENLSMCQFVDTFQAVSGTAGRVSRVPLPIMRAMSMMMRPVNPALARLIQAGVVMDTKDMSFDPTELKHRYPSISLTGLAENLRRNYPGTPSALSA